MIIPMKYLAAAFLVAFAAIATPSLVLAGYTQYFTWKKPPNDDDLKACIAEMSKIIAAAKNLVAGPGGDGQPKIDALHVQFNGIADNANETFDFPGDDGFNFCKTEFKPYDAVVTACLLVARDHFPSATLVIGSDGQWNDGDWNDGAQLYHAVTGREPSDPIADARELLPGGMPVQDDSDWVSKAFWIILAVVVFWWVARPRWEFVIFVEKNKIDRVRGVAARPFLVAVDDICREFTIPRGTIRALRIRAWSRLVFSRSIPADCRQRIHNSWAAHVWRSRMPELYS